MLRLGLTSITFRHLSPEAIIDLARNCELDGIEWGSDVHVPAGDLETAAEVRARTEAADLAVCSYGAYYRADDEAGPFADVLDSASALGAPVVRIWAGRRGSADASSAYREEVVEHIRRAVIAAKELDITVALEYHGGTLTDTQASAHQLLDEVGLPELKLYWQPRTGGTFDGDIPELEAALPHLAHVHAFHWVKTPEGEIDRRPFGEGIRPWREYLKRIRKADGDRYIIFEFVRNDAPEQLIEDSQVLRRLINE